MELPREGDFVVILNQWFEDANSSDAKHINVHMELRHARVQTMGEGPLRLPSQERDFRKVQEEASRHADQFLQK